MQRLNAKTRQVFLKPTLVDIKSLFKTYVKYFSSPLCSNSIAASHSLIKKILGKKKTILGIFTCGHVLLQSPSLPRSSPLIQAWASSHTHSSQSTKSRRASNPLLSTPCRCSLHSIIKLGIVIFSTFLMCSQQLQVGTTLQQKNYY